MPELQQSFLRVYASERFVQRWRRITGMLDRSDDDAECRCGAPCVLDLPFVLAGPFGRRSSTLVRGFTAKPCTRCGNPCMPFVMPFREPDPLPPKPKRRWKRRRPKVLPFPSRTPAATMTG